MEISARICNAKMSNRDDDAPFEEVCDTYDLSTTTTQQQSLHSHIMMQHDACARICEVYMWTHMCMHVNMHRPLSCFSERI